jgi:hypothetical protein
MPNTPALPADFLPCSGQMVSDAASPYNGQTLPNLNGEQRFLRGSTTSGVLQTDAFQGHFHNSGALTITGDQSASSNDYTGTGTMRFISAAVTGPLSDGVNGTPRISTETRPINMSIIWIMKIK